MGEATDRDAATVRREDTLDTPTALRVDETVGANVDPTGDHIHVLTFADRYRAEATLGEGGMGTVTLCADRQIGRDVALKEIRADHRGNDTVVKRFVYEARLQAQLEHPAILPVYEVGPTPDGDVYFTMKHLRGVTLAKRLDDLRNNSATGAAAQTRRKLLSDFSRLCQAVDYAHQRGVVHCDIKPSNIMFGEYGEVYLLDWGMASLSPPDVRGPDRLDLSPSRPRSMMGTPGYAAPEQVFRPRTVDVRTDVYALGCVLFEILTLKPLHDAPTSEARVDLMLGREPPSPAEAAPTREVPPELDVVCLRATALQPGQRFGSAHAVHAAIERFLDGERDLQLRRDLADEHAVNARDALRRMQAIEAGPQRVEERREALREVGQALALDPTNDSAMATMVRLITRPPKTTPDEVRDRLRIARRERLRAVGRLAVPLYLAMFLYLPFIWWAGIVDYRGVILTLGLALVAAGASAWTAATRRNNDTFLLIAMVASAIAMGGTACFFGPLVLAPGIIASNCTAFAISVGRRARAFAIVLGVLAVVVPLALEWTGVVAPSYQLTDGGMVITPRTILLDGPAALILLTVTSVGMVVTGAFAAGRVRDALDRAERRLEVYAWHFEQLLPEHAQTSTSVRSGE